MNHDNPPAFPFAFQERDRQGNPIQGAEAEPGMSLRDYFAAKAMASMIVVSDFSDNKRVVCAALAETAYAQADAMLAARQQPPTP